MSYVVVDSQVIISRCTTKLAAIEGVHEDMILSIRKQKLVTKLFWWNLIGRWLRLRRPELHEIRLTPQETAHVSLMHSYQASRCRELKAAATLSNPIIVSTEDLAWL